MENAIRNCNMIRPGKLNILLDGQFGSTGKGLVASYIGQNNHIDVAISSASPNAGHTFYIGGKKYITQHLPVAGIINKRSTIYLCAGAIIDPNVLLTEIKQFNIDPNRIYIHPRAAVIGNQDIAAEQYGSVSKIASTRKGVGQALIRKINRESHLSQGEPLLKSFVEELDIQYYLKQDCSVLMETSQGLDLSLNSGLAYPYCTSREITVSAALSDAQIHPKFLGNVTVCIRTYPIRVGHLIENSKILGQSGPFYEDSTELSWSTIGVPAEYTTNTNRVRRVASFSTKQYTHMLKMLEPDYVVLNFANYTKYRHLNRLIKNLSEVTHISFGPTAEDIITIYRGHENKQ